MDKNTRILILLLVFGGIVMANRKKIAHGAAVVAAKGVDEAKMIGTQFANMALPRGIRNNNPGNIVKTPPGKERWVGEIDNPLETHFATFDTLEHGIRAMAKLILNYQKLYGIKTLRAFATKWAPPSENRTTDYMNYLSKAIGVGVDTPINFATYLPKMIRAQVVMESGQLANTLISDNSIKTGISLVA